MSLHLVSDTHSPAFWVDLLVVAVVVIAAATLLTVMFGGGTAENPYSVGVDPAGQWWPR